MSTKNHPKDEMLINLGIIIRRLRLTKGFKSAELFSYENNLNRTAYWRWENGQNITMKNFFKSAFNFSYIRPDKPEIIF